MTEFMMSLLASRLSRERIRAEKESEFLGSLFGNYDPYQNQGHALYLLHQAVYFRVARSEVACRNVGMPGSAVFQRSRNLSYSARAPEASPEMADDRANPR